MASDPEDESLSLRYTIRAFNTTEEGTRRHTQRNKKEETLNLDLAVSSTSNDSTPDSKNGALQFQKIYSTPNHRIRKSGFLGSAFINQPLESLIVNLPSLRRSFR